MIHNASVSLHDIARRVRVSHTTVSNVLNRTGHEKRVSATKASHIRKVARELGYVPNVAARTLKDGKTHTIVFLTKSGLRFPYVHEQIEKIQAELSHHGYHLNLELIPQAQEEEAVYRTLGPGRCDGVIQFVLNPLMRDHLVRIRQRGLPVVVIEPGDDPILDYVDYDRVEALRLATSHLIAQGHERIALVLNELIDREEHLRPRLMYGGYRAALQSAGLPIDNSLLFRSLVWADPRALWDQIKFLSPRPTAVFVYNEQLAAGLVHAIRSSGSRVPEDMAVATMGNSWMVELSEVPLTAIDMNHASIAQKVVERLQQQMRDPNLPARQILVRPSLVVRESSNRHPQRTAKEETSINPLHRKKGE